MISFPAATNAQSEDDQFASHVYSASSYDAFPHAPAEHLQPVPPVPHQFQASSSAAAHFPQQFQFQPPPQPQFHFQPAQFQAEGQQFHALADAQHQLQIQQQQQQQQQFAAVAVAADALHFQSPDSLPFPPTEPLKFQAADSGQLNLRSVHRRRVGPAGESGKPPSVRKFHKADREKLRRDKLNEQFVELARILEPDRPKTDKGTILGDSIQEVRDLRAELRRLKTEHEALLEESREVTQEKSELREERLTLQTQTEQLQAQLQQRLQLLMPWMSPEMPAMIGRAPYPYPSSVHMPGPPAGRPPTSTVGPPAQAHQQHPLVHAPPYAPFPMHPAYVMYGNRQMDGSGPYMPYLQYPPPVPSHSHVERPYAQYASPMHPPPAYLMHMQPPHQGSASPASPFLSYGRGVPEAEPSSVPSASELERANEASHSGPEADQSTSSPHASQEHIEVQTNLQLQTGHSSPLAEAEGGSTTQEQPTLVDSVSSPKTDGVEVEESTAAAQAAQEPSTTATPLNLSLRTSSAASGASCSSASSGSSDVQGSEDEGRQKDKDLPR